MDLSDAQLISETVALNHKGVADSTLRDYGKDLEHFSAYLQSVCGADFYRATRKHVLMFMRHLEKHGGPKPHADRFGCEWCRSAGYPDGRTVEAGWSASARKGFLSAIRFLYGHFHFDDELPSIDPSAHIASPKVVVTRQYTPSSKEVSALLDAPGRPRDRILAHWMSYAPSRRQTFADARWKDFNLEEGWWDVVGKGNVADCFDLAPELLRELRDYRRWQTEVFAREKPAVRRALDDENTAYVLLTYNGKPMAPSSLPKMLKARAKRADVAVKATTAKHDASGGTTSKIGPHALRRAWATVALNEKEVPLDVVQTVLNHKHISTTQMHYAHTKPERAREALRSMKF